MATLAAFHTTIDNYSRQVRHDPTAQLADVTAKMSKVDVGEKAAPPAIEMTAHEADDGRTLEDRLGDSSPELVSTLAAMLSQQLDRARGDVVLALGPHNLGERTIASLFELSPGSTTTDGEAIPNVKVEAIVATLRAAVAEIHAEATVLWPAAEGKVESDFGLESARNDEVATKRWGCTGIRILIRRIPNTAEDLTELRVAVVGNVDAGKSTLLGVLTKGRLDDGRGRARVALFRHKHEIESGRTSSVGLEILGFDVHGNEVTDKAPHGTVGAKRQQLSWDEICKTAAKVISFIDLAGHARYLKTTIFGLTGNNPDCVCLVIGANAGLIGMSKEHLSVALALSVPVFCVVTKVDMTPSNVLDQTLKQLTKILRSPGCRKQPVFVKSTGMAVDLAGSFVKDRACPIFLCSNVNGDGLTPLRAFLNACPTGLDGRYAVDEPLEVSISETFAVPFVGCVVSGVILSGSATVGDPILIGPDSIGQWMPTAIKSIQRKRVNVNSCEAGQSVTFALKRIRRNQVRKGMAVIAKTDGQPPKATRKFEAQILVLYHNTTISPKYQAMCHTGSVRQTVRIVEIHDHEVLRTGDRARVTMEWVSGVGEFIRPGQKLLFREGRCKGLGVVTACL